MKKKANPPKSYLKFIQRYPKLAEAWNCIREAEDGGPFDERTKRLVKLAIAIGSQREGAVHSAVRKALEAGCAPAELNQVVALAASTLGMPTTVAIDSWVQETVGR